MLGYPDETLSLIFDILLLNPSIYTFLDTENKITLFFNFYLVLLTFTLYIILANYFSFRKDWPVSNSDKGVVPNWRVVEVCWIFFMVKES